MIQIRTFGTLQVVRDAETANAHVVAESDWHTRQARQLLKILITERPRPVSTDRLIDIIWPNSTPSAAATTLRSAINALRNVLEPDRPSRAPSKYIITKSPGYAFHDHPDIQLDVAAFEELLKEAEQSTDPADQQRDLKAAVELYHDDYLTSDSYADWAQTERERLRERYFTALLMLAQGYAANAQYAAAIAACRQIIARDPVRENAYQALMRYQAESGDSASALLTYERCRTRLAEELGADPSPLTQAWHQQILNGEIGPQEVVAPQRGGQSTAEPPAQQNATAAGPLVLPPQTLTTQPFSSGTTVADTGHFVGRESELALLIERLQQSKQGRGSLLLIEGEAGAGKSHLVHHLLQQALAGTIDVNGRHADATTPGDFTVIHATCQPLEQQLPFAPLSDGLGRFLHSLPDAILRALPIASLAQFAQLAPSLQDRLPELPVLSTEAWFNSEENRQRLINGLIALLSTLAGARPLLLFLDDLHWADTETLAVLGRLAQRLSQMPILLLLAYRRGELDANEPLATLLYALHPVPFQPHATHANRTVLLTVQRFEPREIAALVGQVTQQQVPADAHLVTLLQTTTEGNPLFVMEALRALQERQRSEPALTWQQLLTPPPLPREQNPAEQETPTAGVESIFQLGQNPRVQEVSLGRIHRLPPHARNLLHLCAVIGRDFSVELLEQLSATTAGTDLVADLELLLQRKFLLERPDDRIDFSHAIVRQVAYENMFTLQRRRLHRRVAAALAALPRAQEIPGEIAFHYRQSGGGANDLVAQYSVLAGERLLHTYGFRQAVSYFDDALALLDRNDTAMAEWVKRGLLGRGLAYESLFDPAGVTSTYSELQAWATARSDHSLLLMAYSRQISMLSLLGQQRESNELLQEFIKTLLQVDDEPLSGFENGSGQTDASRRPASRHAGAAVMLDLFERRQQIFRADSLTEVAAAHESVWAPYTAPPPVVKDPVTIMVDALPPVHAALPLLDYGLTLLIQGQLQEANHCLESVVALAQQTDQPAIAVIAYHQLAVAARIQGDWEQCYALNEQSLAFQQKLQKRTGELVSLWPRIGSGFVALQMGALDEAEQRLARVAERLKGLESFRNHRNSATIGLGLVALERGDITRAETLLRSVLADAIHLYPYIRVQALLGLAQIAAQRKEEETAHQYLQQALRFAGERSLLEEYVITLGMIARLAPVAAPIVQLTDELSRYVRKLGLTPLLDKLAQIRQQAQRKV